MRFVSIAILVATEACAPRVKAPTALEAYSATLPVPGLDDFEPIPEKRCNPPLVGVYASEKALQDAEKGMQHVRDRAARDVIEARAERDVCQIKLDTAAAELAEAAALRVWALIGKSAVVAAAVAAVLTAAAFISNAFGVK